MRSMIMRVVRARCQPGDWTRHRGPLRRRYALAPPTVRAMLSRFQQFFRAVPHPSADPVSRTQLDGPLLAFVSSFWPAPFLIDARERWRMAIGAALGMFVTAWMCHLLGGDDPAAAWLVAPLGASALLVFAVPGSPMAQPWTVLAGNTVSALVGIACAWFIPDMNVAAAACVAAAI